MYGRTRFKFKLGVTICHLFFPFQSKTNYVLTQRVKLQPQVLRVSLICPVSSVSVCFSFRAQMFGQSNFLLCSTPLDLMTKICCKHIFSPRQTPFQLAECNIYLLFSTLADAKQLGDFLNACQVAVGVLVILLKDAYRSGSHWEFWLETNTLNYEIILP